MCSTSPKPKLLSYFRDVIILALCSFHKGNTQKKKFFLEGAIGRNILKTKKMKQLNILYSLNQLI